MGDNVLVEPMASALAQSLNEAVYVVSAYPKLFDGHPHVIGVEGHESDLPEDLRVVDMEQSLMKWGGKLRAMYEQAGVSESQVGAPRLYLKAAEQADVKRLRGFFHGPCIGVVLGSRHGVKQWPYMRLLVKELLKRQMNVFIFGAKTDWFDNKILGLRVYSMIGKDHREMMKGLRMMDVVVGPDTGPLQVAASLGTDTVVVVLPMFMELYEHYDNCTILSGNGHPLNALRSISASVVLDAVEDFLRVPEATVFHKIIRYLLVRIRGMGDVLLSLPAVATVLALNPDAEITYLTSPGCAKMLEGSKLFKEVIACDYRHATYGLPPLPRAVDYSKYNVVHNLINRVEWITASATTPRTEIFGMLMGLDSIDYTTDWKGEIPESWRQRAREILYNQGVKEGDIVIALQITSAGRSRIWAKERWTEFVGKCRHRGYKVVLLSDTRINKSPAWAINLTGQCDITEYIGIIAESSLGVGPDSSLIHVSGWLDHPAIGLFGSIAPVLRIGHYSSVEAIVGKGIRGCVPCNDWVFGSCDGVKHMPVCMWNITANRVIKVVDRLLRDGGLIPKLGKHRRNQGGTQGG